MDDDSLPPPQPPMALSYETAPPVVPTGRYGGSARLLVAANAFGGIALAGAGLLQLGDRPAFGGWMIGAGVAAVVATLRYVSRDAPRWRPAWAASTVCVACVAGLWWSAARADAELSAVDRREFEDVRDDQGWAARTEVTHVELAHDIAVVALPPTALLWAWLTWRAARRDPDAAAS